MSEEETNYTPFVLGGLALGGVVAVLALKKKDRSLKCQLM
jgi:LPXTG-motif cell wall-anchored protein